MRSDNLNGATIKTNISGTIGNINLLQSKQQGNLLLRKIQINEVEKSLELLFEEPLVSAQQAADKVLSFKQVAQKEKYDLSLQYVIVNQFNDIVGASLFVSSPGGTAFVFTSSVERYAIQYPDIVELSHEMIQQVSLLAISYGVKLLQALTIPIDQFRKSMLANSGYTYLTDLVYFGRTLSTPAFVFEKPHHYQWLTYSEENDGLFKEVLSRTYLDSQDCPELENLRTIDDVVLSHKASGVFNPQGWKILLDESQNPLGVVIMSQLRHCNTLELTYMGVVPQARGKGVARILLSALCSHAQTNGNEAITLAVDLRNERASKLYTFFGFIEMFSRSIYLAH